MPRLLVVDDDAAMRRAVTRVLVSEAFDVDEAPTCAEARSLLAANVYERAIFDVRLPDGDGLDLLAWARERGLRLHVLVATGVANAELTGRAYLLGASLVLKPTPADVVRRFAREPLRSAVVDLNVATRAFGEEHALTPRQGEVLHLIMRRVPRRELSRALRIGENTVKTLVRQILAKTECDSVGDLRAQVLERLARHHP